MNKQEYEQFFKEAADHNFRTVRVSDDENCVLKDKFIDILYSAFRARLIDELAAEARLMESI